jgi:hypothetical protein
MRSTLVLLALALAGCSSERSQLHVAAGSLPLCVGGTSLGRVAVRTELVFRADQKEPDKRAAFAEAAVRDALGALPCARAVDVAPPSASERWSAHPEAEVLAGLAAAADTAVLLRLHELGPNLTFTLVPPAWATWTEVDLLARVLDVPSGAVRLDFHRRLERGGPFALRGADRLEGELRGVLEESFVGTPAARS